MSADTTPPSTHRVTRLLAAWHEGDSAATDELMAAVYDELRRIAYGYLRQEREGHTLQPTALVHEAYLRLVDDQQVHWRSRAHFYGVAAKVMRRVLVDHARTHAAAKRGAGVEALPLEAMGEIAVPGGVDYVALDGALQSLAQIAPRQSEVVELRFFGGLTAQEVAEALQVSERTVMGDWKFARSWLKRELETGGKTS